MISYPISFFATAEATDGIQSTWKIESPNFSSACAVPPEFEGPGGALSPEDLFAQALTNCFVATFKVYAEKSKVIFSNLSVRAELIADLGETKKPLMKKCILHVQIQGAQNEDRVRTLVDKAFKSGFIINSVKTEMEMELQFV